MITTQMLSLQPAILEVSFAGAVSLAEVQGSREFGKRIKALNGAPFYVLCDFSHTIAMAGEVSTVFMRAQAFAVERGMVADAFVTQSGVLKLQFSRVAKESGRLDSLGPLRFFDERAEALSHLYMVAAEDGPKTLDARRGGLPSGRP
jgi:hypothetical protein